MHVGPIMGANRIGTDLSMAESDVLIVEVRLKSKEFESRIEIPLDASEEKKRNFIDKWMSLMLAGLDLK